MGRRPGDGSDLLARPQRRLDADTIALISYLAGALAALPVLVAVSARDDQSMDPPGSGATLRVSDRPTLDGVISVRLDRLTPTEVNTKHEARRYEWPQPLDGAGASLAS